MNIGSFTVGGGGGVMVVAEAGINHDGSLSIARDLVCAAVEAGADAVKFQTFNADELGAPDLVRYEFSRGDWIDLAGFCRRKGILFFSTPFDCESVDLLDPLVPCFKIASGEITNTLLLRYVAEKEKPVILSTGMATLTEIVKATEELHGIPIIGLHCVSAYPAPVDEMNLKAMVASTWPFRYTGLSDHSLSLVVPAAAVALGAVMIEKHLTVGVGPDHHMSLNPVEFRQMVNNIREVESALGDGRKRVMPSEEETRRRARRDPKTGRRPAWP